MPNTHCGKWHVPRPACLSLAHTSTPARAGPFPPAWGSWFGDGEGAFGQASNNSQCTVQGRAHSLVECWTCDRPPLCWLLTRASDDPSQALAAVVVTGTKAHDGLQAAGRAGHPGAGPEREWERQRERAPRRARAPCRSAIAASRSGPGSLVRTQARNCGFVENWVRC